MENIVIGLDFKTSDCSPIFLSEIQVVPGDIAWEDIELMLKVYADQESIKVSYSDDDNDLVIIESQEELEEAFKVARKCNNTLRLTVICSGQPCPPDPFPTDRDAGPYVPGKPYLDFFSGDTPVFPSQLRSAGEPQMSATGFGGCCQGKPSVPGAISVEKRIGDGSGELMKEIGADFVAKDSEERKVFFIACGQHEDLVLDVEGHGTHPGNSVIVWMRKQPIEDIMNQLWYADDRTSTIRTCLNDFCLDVINGRMVVNPCDLNKTSQKWSFTNNRIQNVFSLKWVVGLKQREINSYDPVYGSAEDELVHVDWIKKYVDLQRGPDWLGRSTIPCCRFVPRPVSEYVVICDVCDKRIQGIRYKCGFCLDFDLCAACEAKEGVHDPTHVLLKLNVAVEQAQLRYSTIEPLMTRMDCCFDMEDDREFLEQALVKVQLDYEARHPDEKTRWKEKFQESLEEVAGQADCPAGDSDQEDVLSQDTRRADLLTVEDLLSAELNPRELNGTSLTVPANTPLADTPPRTPMVMEASEPDLASQIDGPADASSTATDGPDFLNMAVMADLVHKKMSDLVTAAGNSDYDYVDEDGDSDSSNYSDDFYIVPVPDCFNPNLPPRKEASTTVVIKKSSGATRGSCSYKSVDDMLRTSSCLASAPLLSPKCCFSTGSLDDEPSDLDSCRSEDVASGQEEVQERFVIPLEVEVETSSSNGELAVEPADEEDEMQQETAEVVDENSNVEVDVNQNETDRYVQGDNEQSESQQSRMSTEDDDQEPEHEESRTDRADESSFASGVEASTLKLMSSVFSFVAKTAKDVFHTLQDKNSYIPPRSDWTPSQNQWTPPQNQWAPPSPSNAWTPPQQPTWSPPAHQWTAPTSDLAGQSSPMDQLIAMGFADRQLNEQLLLSSNNNIETVVQKLVEMSGNVR